MGDQSNGRLLMQHLAKETRDACDRRKAIRVLVFIGNMKASVAIDSGSGLQETNQGSKALSRVANMSTKCGPKLCSI